MHARVCFTLCTVASLMWPEAFAHVAPPPLAHAAASVLTRAVFTLVSVAASRRDVGLRPRTFGRPGWHQQPRVHKHVSEAAQEVRRAPSPVPSPAPSCCSDKETVASGCGFGEGVGLLVQQDFRRGRPGAAFSGADQPDEADHATQGGFHPVPPVVGQELGQLLDQGAGPLTSQAAETQTSLRQLNAEDQLVRSLLHQGSKRSLRPEAKRHIERSLRAAMLRLYVHVALGLEGEHGRGLAVRPCEASEAAARMSVPITDQQRDANPSIPTLVAVAA